MSHSLTRIWIHAILGTKKRQPLILKQHRQQIYRQLREQFSVMGCFVKRINGVEDHVHVQFQLQPTQSLAAVMRQVKGATCRWINQEQMCVGKFEWQVGMAPSR